MLKPAIRLCLLALVIVARSTTSFAQGELPDTIADTYATTVSDNLPDLSFLDDRFPDRVDIWSQPTLTGDWGGYRTRLDDAGITFAGRSTQFGFGINGGINTPPPPPLGLGNTFKYTGRGEYDLILDFEKLVGIPKATLLVRAENLYGQFENVSVNSGAFAPTVFPAALPPGDPNQPGVPYLTNFLYTQQLSQNLVVYGGKKDVLGDVDQDIFAGGDGTSQFVNQALIANPSLLLGLPYSSYTAGFVSPQTWGNLKGYLWDPTDRTADALQLSGLFSKGIIVGTEILFNTNFFELPGEQHFGGVWKHHPLNNLAFSEPPPGVYPEPTNPLSPTLLNSYTLYYGFDQFLVQFSGDKPEGWGLFGRASISDGNPTPVQYFLSLGLGGDSPVRRGRGDKFGIGWYFVGASNQFGPIPRAIYGPTNGQGLELYYNVQVNRWLNITPDLQFIHPDNQGIAEDSFVYGLRANMTL